VAHQEDFNFLQRGKGKPKESNCFSCTTAAQSTYIYCLGLQPSSVMQITTESHVQFKWNAFSLSSSY